MLPPGYHSQQAGTILPTLMRVPPAVPPADPRVRYRPRIKLSALYAQKGSETGQAAMHSTGSSHDGQRQCGIRTENDVERAARQIRDLEAANLPVRRRSEKSKEPRPDSWFAPKQTDRCLAASDSPKDRKLIRSAATAEAV